MPQSWCGNSAEENHEETQLNMVGQFVLFKHASNPVPSLSCPCLQHLPHLDAYATLWIVDKFDIFFGNSCFEGSINSHGWTIFFVGCPGRLFREDLGKICVFEKLGRKNRNRTLGWFIMIYPSNQFSNSIELWSPTTAFSRLISWEMWRPGRRGDFGSRIALWASLGYPKWGWNQNLRVILWDVNGMDFRWNSNNSENSMGWMLVSRKMEPFPGSCFRNFWFRFSTLYHSSRVMIF